jgi:hypothetical protein
MRDLDLPSRQAARPRRLLQPTSKVVREHVEILQLDLTQIQTLLRLIQRLRIHDEKGVRRSMDLVRAFLVHVRAAVTAEVFVDGLDVRLVVAHLGLVGGGD